VRGHKGIIAKVRVRSADSLDFGALAGA